MTYNLLPIMPVSDLRNKYSKVESICLIEKKPIIFTKNGKSSVVLIDIDEFKSQQEEINNLNAALMESNNEIAKLKALNDVYGGLLDAEASINRTNQSDKKVNHLDKVKMMKESLINVRGV